MKHKNSLLPPAFPNLQLGYNPKFKIEMTVNQPIIKNKYQIIKLLGEGSFGKTYLAEDIKSSTQRYAIKHLQIPQNNVDFEKARELFKREAEVLQSLNGHLQIPQFIDYFEEKQEFYLVEEFIDGNLLTQELPLIKSEQEIINLLREILLILQFIHQNNIIHRDIKPDNLIRRKGGNIILIDFGAVKQLLTQTLIQKPATRIHTPGYAPPEQIHGYPQFNSDIYALGMTIIQALTGLEPSQLTNDIRGEIIWQNQVKFNHSLTPILNKMIRYNFNERYQSVQEILRDLDNLNPINQVNHQVIYPTIISRLDSDSPQTQPKDLYQLIEKGLFLILLISSILLLLLNSGVIKNSWIHPPTQPKLLKYK